jgi:hypothetical protein
MGYLELDFVVERSNRQRSALEPGSKSQLVPEEIKFKRNFFDETILSDCNFCNSR